MERRLTSLRNIFMALSAIGLLGWLYLLHLVQISPTEPNNATGHVVLSYEHGRSVYITPLVHILRDYVAPVAIGIFIAVSVALARGASHTRVPPRNSNNE